MRDEMSGEPSFCRVPHLKNCGCRTLRIGQLQGTRAFAISELALHPTIPAGNTTARRPAYGLVQFWRNTKSREPSWSGSRKASGSTSSHPL
jgi:hypothetical protein